MTGLVDELRALRKQALSGLSLEAHAELLQAALQAEDPATSLLVFKVCDNVVSRLGFAPSPEPNRAVLTLLVSLSLAALSDARAALRKAAIYNLSSLLSSFLRSGTSPADVLGAGGLAAVAQHLADSGCDLNSDHLPVKPKGTLTISEKAYYIIAAYPKKTDFAPVYQVLVPSLERLHVLIYNGWLSAAQGAKLIDRQLAMFDLLMITKQAPFPPAEPDGLYPDFITGLLAFCNDPAYKAIPDSAIVKLQRLLVQSSRHTGSLVEALASEDYPLCRDSALRLLARKLEQGQKLDYFRPRLEALLSPEELDELTGVRI